MNLSNNYYCHSALANRFSFIKGGREGREAWGRVRDRVLQRKRVVIAFWFSYLYRCVLLLCKWIAKTGNGRKLGNFSQEMAEGGMVGRAHRPPLGGELL